MKQCTHPTCGDECRRPKKVKKWRAKPKPISDKQVKALTIYRKAKREYLKAHPTCEAHLEGCQREADQIHHKAGRIGEALYDPANFLAVCGNCHRIIETQPKRAKELNLSVSRLNKAS